jgi:LAO/AO transport system kinase
MSVVAEVLEARIATGARLIRWLEDADPRGRTALRELYPHTGRAQVIGVTGPPGAGKSTLVDGLIAEYRRLGRRVGVIAVDPSSPFSGGAVLGDRVRMQRHAADAGVFIRSMATRGQLGGLARSTFDATLVLDAMGYDPVLIETVGVGQDEVDIIQLAHTTVLVSVPGMGDEVQAIKAGVLEAGQIFVINKADRPGADQLHRQLEMMLHLRESGGDASAAWHPPLLATVASRDEGVPALAESIARHREHLEAGGGFARQLAERSEQIMLGELRSAVTARIIARALDDPQAAAIIEKVRERRIDPYTAVDALLARFDLVTAAQT